MDHLKFIRILKKVLKILESGKKGTGKSFHEPRTPTTEGGPASLVEQFRGLTIEESSPESALNVQPSSKPERRDEIADLASPQEKSEAIKKFGNLMKAFDVMHGHLKLELENLNAGCIQLETLTMASEIRTLIAGTIINGYISGFENCRGIMQVAAWYLHDHPTEETLEPP